MFRIPQIQALSYGLERVTEGAMADVMQKRSGQRRFSTVLIEIIFANMAFDNAHEPPCIKEHTKAVGETCMCCAWIYIFREPELPNSAEPLKRDRLNDLPEHLFEQTRVKFDQVMQWISYPLWASLGS